MVRVNRVSGEMLLAAVLTLAGWAFTAGVFYRELTDLERSQAATDAREERIEQKLDKLQVWVDAVSADNERTGLKKEAQK
jgi:hypothetical protein